MNAYLEAFVILLVPAVSYLVWRVWRLECDLKSVRNHPAMTTPIDFKTFEYVTFQLEPKQYSDYVGYPVQSRFSVASVRDVGDVRRDLKSLATALGYEWKSTPAKSGWEKRDSGPGCDYYNLLRHKVALYTSLDRRKGGDRRKPTASGLAADNMLRESPVAKAVKRAQKKPRRAH